MIVDPVAEAVTHLVVEPEHRRGLGRLVPLDLIDATAGQIRLRCTLAEFEKLDPAEETQFIPGTGGYAGLRPGPGGLLALLRPGRGRPGHGRRLSGGLAASAAGAFADHHL